MQRCAEVSALEWCELVCEWEELEGLERKGLEHPAKEGGVCAPLRVMAALRFSVLLLSRGSLSSAFF